MEEGAAQTGLQLEDNGCRVPCRSIFSGHTDLEKVRESQAEDLLQDIDTDKVCV